MDDGSTFCEKCGLDRDRLGSAGASRFNVCPACSSSCCSNCWNQVVGACLACRPFQLAPAGPVAVTPGVSVRSSGPVPAPTWPTMTPATAPRPERTPRERARPAAAAVIAAPPAPGASGPAARRIARRGAGKAVRLALVVIAVLAMVVGVRAVSFQGGAVSVHDPVTNAPIIADPADDPSWVTPAATGAGATNPATRDERPGRTGHPPAVGANDGGGDSDGSGSSGGGSGGTGGAGGGGGGGGDGSGAGDGRGPGASGGVILTPQPTIKPTPAPTPTDPPTPAPTDPPTPAPTDPPTPTPEPTP